MNTADLKMVFGMAPEAAVQYMKQKGYRITWDWHEALNEAHDRAFTVAKAMRLDILQDIRGALEDALRQGKTLRQFQQELTPILQAKGWWGKQFHVDAEGKAQQVQLGSPRRLKTIFQTNTQSAYMAGRYRHMEATKDALPYWQYIAVLDGRTRPSHRALNGRVFAATDPVWDFIRPLNGWGCRCDVRALSPRMLEREGHVVESSAGRLATVIRVAGTDKRTGEIRHSQVRGLRVTGADGRPMLFTPDVGFDYNPGSHWLKPFTPPPLDDLPHSFPVGHALPPMPAASPFPSTRLLPDSLSEEEYVNAFMAEFGGSLTTPVVFQDVSGTPLVIAAELFKDKRDNWKVNKNGRAAYLLMLADAIRDPDEIWMTWQPVKSQPFVLRRRYIKRFTIAGSELPGLAVFEEGADGWLGTTLFQVDVSKLANGVFLSNDDYINAQRGGFLQYRKR